MKSDMTLVIEKGPSPKPLPKVENIHIMVHHHACSKAAYEKTNQQPKVDKSMWTPVLHGTFVMHKKKKRSRRWNIEFLLPYILTPLSHVTVAYSKQCALIA